MAEFGIGVVGFNPANEDINTYVEGKNVVKAPVIDDINNPPSGFSFVEGGVYFDRTTSKLYVTNTTGDVEEISSAPPGLGGGTITGGTNTGSGSYVFTQLVSGGEIMEFKSIVGSDTINVSDSATEIIIEVESAPALRFNGDDFDIPNGPGVNHILAWNGTQLEWRAETGGGGGGGPVEHETNHFVDSTGASDSFLRFSIANVADGETLTAAFPTVASSITDTVVLEDTTQTLTNKTITSATNTLDVAVSDISGTLPIASGGTGTTSLPTGLLTGDGVNAITATAIPGGALVGTTETQTLTNKTIDGASNPITNVSLTTGITGTLGVANGGTGVTSLTAGALLGSTEVETFTNKTISVSGNSITGTNDTVLEVNGSGDVVSSRAAPSGAFVGTTGVQTLESKVLGTGSSLGVNLDANTNKIINLDDPTTNKDAANKEYVDTAVSVASSGLTPKQEVQAATTADLGATYVPAGGTSGNGAFTGAPLNVDGVTLEVGERVLVKDQTDPLQNGIYTVVVAVPGSWERADDHDNSPLGEVKPGNYVFVEGGTISNNFGYVVLGTGAIVINTDPINWGVYSSPGTISAGDGLNDNMGTFEVVGKNFVDVDASGVGLVSNGSTAQGQPLLSGATDGDIPVFGALDLSSSDAVTGVLDVANGGTGVSSLSVGALLGSADGETLQNKVINGSSTGNNTISIDADDVVGGILSVTIGGTGVSDPAAGSILVGSGSGTMTEVSPPATSGLPLVSQGVGMDPSYQTLDLNDEDITTGELLVSRGGTGRSTLSAGSLLVGDGVNDMNEVAIGATGLPLVSNGTTPAYASLDLAGSGVTGILAVANGGTGVSAISDGQILIGNGSGDFVASNPEFIDTTFELQDDGDPTKVLTFDASGITTATTRLLSAPDADGTIVLDDAAQTLTTKTLDDASNTISADKLFVGANSLDVPGAPGDGTFLSYSTTGPALAWTTPAAASAPDILANTAELVEIYFETKNDIDLANVIATDFVGDTLPFDTTIGLVRRQFSNQEQNGIYTFNAGTPNTLTRNLASPYELKRGKVVLTPNGRYYIEGDESDGAINVGVDPVIFSTFSYLITGDIPVTYNVDDNNLSLPNALLVNPATSDTIHIDPAVDNITSGSFSVAIGSSVCINSTLANSTIIGARAGSSGAGSILTDCTIAGSLSSISNGARVGETVYGSESGLGSIRNLSVNRTMWLGSGCNDTLKTYNYDSMDPSDQFVPVEEGDIFMGMDNTGVIQPLIHARSDDTVANWSPGRPDADLGTADRPWRQLVIQDRDPASFNSSGIRFFNNLGASVSSISSRGAIGMYDFCEVFAATNSSNYIDNVGQRLEMSSSNSDPTLGHMEISNADGYTTIKNISGVTRRWCINTSIWVYAPIAPPELLGAQTWIMISPTRGAAPSTNYYAHFYSQSDGVYDSFKGSGSTIVEIPNNYHVHVCALGNTSAGSDWQVFGGSWASANCSSITIFEMPM